MYSMKLKIGMLYHMNNTFQSTIFQIAVNVVLTQLLCFSLKTFCVYLVLRISSDDLIYRRIRLPLCREVSFKRQVRKIAYKYSICIFCIYFYYIYFRKRLLVASFYDILCLWYEFKRQILVNSSQLEDTVDKYVMLLQTRKY